MSEPNSAGAVIEGDYMEVDGDGKPVNPQAQPGAAQPGANDNETQDNAESVEERLRIKTYEKLDSKRKAEVDAIIETINVFDLSSIFSLGAGPMAEYNEILEKIIAEQDKHDAEEGGVYAEFSAITAMREESEASEIFRKVKEYVNEKREAAAAVVENITEKAGVIARVGSLLMMPLTIAADKLAEWREGRKKKDNKEKTGARAIEYAAEKEERERDFKNKHTIPDELKNDILAAAAQEKTNKIKVEKALKGIPQLRITFEGLVSAQVLVFDALENYIIAGEKEAETLKKIILPQAEEEALLVGTQEKRLEVQSLQSGLDRLEERVHTLRDFRYSAMVDAISFQERKSDLERIEGQYHACIARFEIKLSRLMKIRMTLTAGRLDEIIEQINHAEIEDVERDTAVHLAMAEIHKHKGDSTIKLADAHTRNLLSRQKEFIARQDSRADQREKIQIAKDKMINLTEKAARLAAPTDDNIAQIRQEIATADAAEARAKDGRSLALDWSARSSANAGSSSAGTALAPVRRPGVKDKPRPNSPEPKKP